ncbi:MAG TPA: 50S ribosomal protein L1 [Ktedonobacterales bacterium]|jgi:large subunit ribosomal protein L1|nr:50S ribosomal protein L1 [Ktedonobacterales bacterium]
MLKHGKKYNEAAKLIEADKLYTPDEAVQLLKKLSYVKFDPTVELHLKLGVDPRHADQMVRGTATLPAGSGKEIKVLVFAQGERVAEAEQAGADFVGLDDMIKQVNDGWLGFDVAVATPDVMSKVASLGRRLGPRGLMPNPKTGTVTFEVARAVREVKAGRVEFRVDKTSLLHVPIGKLSFTEDQLMRNLAATIDAIVRAKPAGAKGQYVRSVTLCSTMSPSVRLDPAAAQSLKVS